MNTYEFLLLMAHLGAPEHHIKYAGDAVGKALNRGAISYTQNAAQWMDAVPFDKAPDSPAPWVAYIFQLMSMPTTWVVSGLPEGEARRMALGKISTITETTIKRNKSCHKSCGPSDYKKGGKCDKNGCYSEPEETEQLAPEGIQITTSNEVPKHLDKVRYSLVIQSKWQNTIYSQIDPY